MCLNLKGRISDHFLNGQEIHLTLSANITSYSKTVYHIKDIKPNQAPKAIVITVYKIIIAVMMINLKHKVQRKT